MGAPLFMVPPNVSESLGLLYLRRCEIGHLPGFLYLDSRAAFLVGQNGEEGELTGYTYYWQ